MGEKHIVWIDWAFLGRSRNIASRLGVNYYHFDYFSGKPQKIFVFLRYFLASIKTISFLILKNPRIVIMTGTPPFPQFIVHFFSKIKAIKYVIDTHGGYFDDPKFQILPRLRKKIMENAFFHIVTNDVHKNVVESCNGRAVVLGVLMEHNDNIKEYAFGNGENFVWIASYSPDEPLEIVFDVARSMPNVNIYITGNIKKARKHFVEHCKKFKNIILTGFLPTEKYNSYIKGSTAVIALTTLDNTMQRGAYTALSYNVPIITSNWSLLKDSFYKGTVHIENNAIGLENAIKEICNNRDRYRKEISELNIIETKNFNGKIQKIKEKLRSGLGET